MKKLEVTVKNKSGLHARPASMFVKLAKGFTSVIEVEKDGKKVNGKSMLGLLSVSIGSGDKINLIATGDDETSAISALDKLFNETLLEV